MHSVIVYTADCLVAKEGTTYVAAKSRLQRDTAQQHTTANYLRLRGHPPDGTWAARVKIVRYEVAWYGSKHTARDTWDALRSTRPPTHQRRMPCSTHNKQTRNHNVRIGVPVTLARNRTASHCGHRRSRGFVQETLRLRVSLPRHQTPLLRPCTTLAH